MTPEQQIKATKLLTEMKEALEDRGDKIGIWEIMVLNNIREILKDEQNS